MKPSQDIKPITYMKTNSADLIKQVTTQKKPVVITQNGEAKVVILDIQSFEKDRETLLLLKLLSQGVQDIEAGRTVDHDVLFDRLEKQLTYQ